jgi:hypothetical protein
MQRFPPGTLLRQAAGNLSCRALDEQLFLVTYLPKQGTRVSRQSTIWRHRQGDWRVLTARGLSWPKGLAAAEEEARVTAPSSKHAPSGRSQCRAFKKAIWRSRRDRRAVRAALTKDVRQRPATRCRCAHRCPCKRSRYAPRNLRTSLCR